MNYRRPSGLPEEVELEPSEKGGVRTISVKMRALHEANCVQIPLKERYKGPGGEGANAGQGQERRMPSVPSGR